MPQQQLNRINEKIQQLVASYELLQRENVLLRKQNLESAKKLDEQANRIAGLEQTVAVLRTLSGSMETADKKELEKRLNQYLRDIDRCISMLSS